MSPFFINTIMKKQLDRPTCKQCKINLGEWNYRDKNTGIVRYRSICKTCRLTNNPSGHKQHRKDKCERCGFTPEHICQLDVDHIDGNHKNNNVENLQTLCANCHRLKTKQNNDWTRNPSVYFFDK